MGSRPSCSSSPSPRALRRYPSEVEAVCVSCARTVLCGGCWVTGIPTAAAKYPDFELRVLPVNLKSVSLICVIFPRPENDADQADGFSRIPSDIMAAPYEPRRWRQTRTLRDPLGLGRRRNGPGLPGARHAPGAH